MTVDRNYITSCHFNTYPDLLALVARMESIRSRSAKLRSSATVLSSRVTAMLLVWDVAKETKKFKSDPHFIRVKIKMRPILVFFLNYIIWYITYARHNFAWSIKRFISKLNRNTATYCIWKRAKFTHQRALQFVSTFSKERAASNDSIEGRTHWAKRWKRRGPTSSTRPIDNI
jgi:hypothetical protein